MSHAYNESTTELRYVYTLRLIRLQAFYRQMFNNMKRVMVSYRESYHEMTGIDEKRNIGVQYLWR